MQRSTPLSSQQAPGGTPLGHGRARPLDIENRLNWQLDVTFQEGQRRFKLMASGGPAGTTMGRDLTQHETTYAAS